MPLGGRAASDVRGGLLNEGRHGLLVRLWTGQGVRAEVKKDGITQFDSGKSPVVQ